MEKEKSVLTVEALADLVFKVGGIGISTVFLSEAGSELQCGDTTIQIVPDNTNIQNIPIAGPKRDLIGAALVKSVEFAGRDYFQTVKSGELVMTLVDFTVENEKLYGISIVTEHKTAPKAKVICLLVIPKVSFEDKVDSLTKNPLILFEMFKSLFTNIDTASPYETPDKFTFVSSVRRSRFLSEQQRKIATVTGELEK